MKAFLFVYPDIDDSDVGVIYTEEAIEVFYREHMDAMAIKCNKPFLSHEELLEEFCIMHWATELNCDY